MDGLFEKQKQREAELAKLDEELAELEQQNSELPAQFKHVEDHAVRTEQEYRRLELEKKELDRAQKELDKAQAELESKKARGRAPTQVRVSDAQKGQKKSLRGLLNPKRRKFSTGDSSALSSAKGGSTPPDGVPQLQCVPDEDFDAPLARHYSESVQTLPTHRDKAPLRFNTDSSSGAQLEAERPLPNPMMSKKGSSLRFDSDGPDDDDLEAQPNFAHDASVSTNSHRTGKKSKGRKGRKDKPRKATKGTINKGGARQSTGGACCGTGGDGCSIF